MKDLITEARELCSKATPGPWGYDGMHNEVHCHEDYFLIVSELRESPHEELLDEFGHTYNPNFALIARSRSLIPELCDALEKAEEEIPRWIPVAERLPEHHVPVIAHCESGKIVIDYYGNCGWTCISYGEVTHWMELPDPPQKGD